ncbi:MAG: M23 family metallopeptidase [bacterium]|nr:M23 family metallopeptidase [bacterium]
MKKNIKLKKFVMPTIYSLLTTILVVSTIMSLKTSNANDEDYPEKINYVSNIIWSNDIPVVSTEKLIIKPFKNENVKVGKYFYDYKADESSQKNSIIYYENSYIQNSGVDYILEKSFDIVPIYNGTVSKIEDNELLGKTIEIKHDNNVISVYQGLSEIKVKTGDNVTQETVLGKSGTSEINKDLGNHLHLEIYVNGEIVNPENCYNKKINEI